jgi:hypothetical protein
MNDQLEKFVQQNRKAFDDLEPDSVLIDRIVSELDLNQKKSKITIKRFLRWSAAAVFVSLAGIGLFHLFQTKPNIIDKEQAKVQAKPEKVDQDIAVYVMKMKVDMPSSKVSRSKYVVMRSGHVNPKDILLSRLSNQVSAGERYAAASSIAQIKQIDYSLLTTLLKTMNNDPNTNVRLAALEALSHFAYESFVKDQLIRSLAKQKDPIVQISLIELLTEMRECNIVRELEKLTEDYQTDEEVKAQAYISLLKLSS